jgi:hypothetical protein
MDLNEAITGRRAVREYTDEAVDERTIRRLIIAGHPKAAPPPVPRKEPEVRWIG